MINIYLLFYKKKLLYVGATKNPKQRLMQHKGASPVTKAEIAISKCRPNLSMEVIDEVSNKEWEFWEQHYISLYKSWGFELLNKHIGGSVLNKGRKYL